MDSLSNNNWNDVHRYIHSLRNKEKARYAEAYYAYCRYNASINDADFNLGYMVKQAVRMNLAEFGVEK